MTISFKLSFVPIDFRTECIIRRKLQRLSIATATSFWRGTHCARSGSVCVARS